MSTTSITFRGETDVEIEYRMGRYESDTNCQECEWWFTDERFKDVEPTDEEDAAILAKLYGIDDEPDEFNVPLSPLPRDRPLGTPLSELSTRPGEPGYEEWCRFARSWGYD